ncbi:MAG: class I SAM-dependent methyltransferase [Methylophilus sp.]|uniref:class I SAM-dependent methyltransferase n=1 Tax=Methylophilus sp. TaxID=29541 RepID=UPI003FA17562
MVRGTAGYERFIDHFIASGQALSFSEVCNAFLAFLPKAPANILDAGAGAGQNAMAFAEMGHSVVAVEPMIEFLNAARNRYSHSSITWHHDSLPTLQCLADGHAQFDFILVDGVWHHLDDIERQAAIQRFAQLLKTGGRCALSLRNGPAGMGTHVFATDAEQTILQAANAGLKCVMLLKDQPSMFSFKPDVIWSRVVFEKA